MSKALRRFDYVTVTNRSEYDYIVNRGVSREKVLSCLMVLAETSSLLLKVISLVGSRLR